MVCLLFSRAHAADLVYAPEPVDNPLSGLVPYVFADGHENFPHSLEFQYFAFDQLMTGWSTFDWTAIEETLAKTSSRGNQLVLRIYLEYPGKPSAVPQFLRDAGVKVTKWKSSDGDCYTPDYENKSLRRAIEEFITALGKQYDNDPRMGFVTAGILGSWGEWHTYPRTDLWASKDVQSEVLSAYSAAFKKVPVLLRYPAGQNHPHQAANDSHEFGYHDDSFAWATLDTGRKDDSWFYMSILKQAGPKAVSKWQTSPIGGEIRPELWKNLFTDDQHPKQQDFAKCVSVTHASWLMESGLFKKHDPPSTQRVNRGKQQVRRLGYELHVRRANLDGGTLKLVVENQRRCAVLP